MITAGLVTHHRPQLFRRALEALANTRAQIEYVILINGNDKESEELADHFASQNPTARVFKRRTTLAPGEARNFLVSHAQTDWIYFADDDAEVSPNLFNHFEQSLKQTPHAQVFGGPNLTPSDSTPMQVACGDALGSKLGSFRCADRYRATERAVVGDDTKLILCNLFVKTSLALQTPFPADYICAEENYALAKWREQNAVFVYDPRLSVTHARRQTWTSFAQQVCKYGRGRGRLIARGEFRWFHVVPLVSLATLVSPVVFMTALAIYASLLGLATIRYSRTHSAELTAHFALAILVIHASYAVGTCVGALIDAPLAFVNPQPVRSS